MVEDVGAPFATPSVFWLNWELIKYAPSGFIKPDYLDQEMLRKVFIRRFGILKCKA